MGEGPGFPEGDPLGNSGLKEALSLKGSLLLGMGQFWDLFDNLGPFESLLISKGPYFVMFGVNLC